MIVVKAAATNKCFARSYKSCTRAEATKKRKRRRGAIWCAGQVSQRQDRLLGRDHLEHCRNLPHLGRVARG